MASQFCSQCSAEGLKVLSTRLCLLGPNIRRSATHDRACHTAREDAVLSFHTVMDSQGAKWYQYQLQEVITCKSVW
jgi:hypothetical protein